MERVDCCSFTEIYRACTNGQGSRCNPPQVRVRGYRGTVRMTQNTTQFLYINFIYHRRIWKHCVNTNRPTLRKQGTLYRGASGDLGHVKPGWQKG